MHLKISVSGRSHSFLDMLMTKKNTWTAHWYELYPLLSSMGLLMASSPTAMSGMLILRMMGSKVILSIISLIQIAYGCSSTGFAQKRYPNGTFKFQNPSDCSPKDDSTSRACSLQGGNENGFYESSSWEYSLWDPAIFAWFLAKFIQCSAMPPMTPHIWSSSWVETYVFVFLGRRAMLNQRYYRTLLLIAWTISSMLVKGNDAVFSWAYHVLAGWILSCRKRTILPNPCWLSLCRQASFLCRSCQRGRCPKLRHKCVAFSGPSP